MIVKSITELCDIQIGRTPKRSEKKYWNKGFTWISISDMQSKYIDKSKEEVTDIAVKECNMKLIPKNTVIMSFKLSIGKLAITEKDLYTNEAIAGFIINDTTRLLPEYLYYTLRGYNFDSLIDRAAKGSTLNKSKLSHIKIPLVDIQRQKEIINILGKGQRILDKRKKQIAALSSLKQSIFLDMFGDPILNSNNYEKLQLKDIGEVQTGNTPSRKNPEYYGDYIEWIKSDNIIEGNTFLTNGKEYLSEEGMEKGRVAKSGSILVTCIAGSKISIGKSAIADRNVAFNQQINSITPFENIDNIFLQTQISLSKKMILQHSTQSMKGLISKSEFEKIKFIVPPIKKQKMFSELILKLLNKRKQLVKSLRQLEYLNASLTQKAFNGELFNV